MSSLRGAPTLSPGQRKGFSYEAAFDDDYIGPVDTVEEIPSSSPSRKERKKEKKAKKEKKKKEKNKSYSSAPEGRSDDAAYSSSSVKQSSSSKVSHSEEVYADDYEDDFEDSLGSDDYIPTVESPPPPAAAASARSANSQALSAKIDAEEKRLYETMEAQIKIERDEHAKKMAKWEAECRQKEGELLQKERELFNQQLAQKKLEDEMQARVDQLVQEKVSQQISTNAVAAAAAAAAAANKEKTEESFRDPHVNMGDLTEAQKGELMRRRRREHDRAVSLRRAEEESAAHALFQRLAQDVREVFHELNLSVVAAEKERLIKDERYRREREMKDRKEEIARAEKIEKELKERAERESKFWSLAEERDEKFRTFLEERMRKDEEERESRLQRDLQDRETRMRNERQLRDDLDQMEKERRTKSEQEYRDHDNLLLQGQLGELKNQYTAQLEELRRQMDADSTRKAELQRAELSMMEKRHEAALQQLQHQHGQQLAVMEGHTGNTSRIEGLVKTMQEEMEATKAMNEQLLTERMNLLQQKERQLTDQRVLLEAMVDDLKSYRQEMDKERGRVASLYAKFELAVSSFTKNSEEDRRAFREGVAHYDTLRLQAEKDRKMMLTEVSQERKLLEQQYEEFLAKKMDAIGELQAERIAISRERTESSMLRERQNRNETDLLKSLHSREEEYKLRLESIEADRAAACQMKEEHQRLCASVQAEREALLTERERFEMEKKNLLSRFDAIRQQAIDAAGAQERLQKQIVGDRLTREYNVDESGMVTSPLRAEPLSCSAVSRLQMDLARQRSVLQNIM